MPTLSIERPSLALLGLEPLRAAYEFAAHQLVPAPAPSGGDGHPVVIFPGLGTDGTAVAPLRRYCQSLGYEALDWGRGFNLGPEGDIDTWLADLQSDTAALLRQFRQKATFIGWSLGGIYARELSKTMRPQVRQVITLGTPFNASGDHSRAGWVFRLLSGQAPSYTAAMSAQLRQAPAVPTTSIYSRSDGVVAWQTCRHRQQTYRVQDLEVRGSHVGLGWNREVLRIVADRLAQAPGRWLRYAPEATDGTPR